MPRMGPNTKVRIQGQPEHDLATIEWTVSGPITPFTQLGDTIPKTYTAGIEEVSFNGEAQSKADGTFAIDWFGWRKNKEMHPLVADSGGMQERLVDAVIEEIGSSPRDENGAYRITFSGKARYHEYYT